MISICEAAEIDDEAEISHECGLDEGHEFSHKCFCGHEF